MRETLAARFRCGESALVAKEAYQQCVIAQSVVKGSGIDGRVRSIQVWHKPSAHIVHSSCPMVVLVVPAGHCVQVVVVVFWSPCPMV